MTRRLARTTEYILSVVLSSVVVILDTLTVSGFSIYKLEEQTSGRGFSLDKRIKGSEINSNVRSGVFAKAGKKGVRLPFLPSEKHQNGLVFACSQTRN